MWNCLCNFLTAMTYENGIPSLTRFFSIISFIAFLAASFYLMWNNQQWGHYDTFAFITGGGGATTQIFNKYFNSKYSSKGIDLASKPSNDGVTGERQPPK